MATPSQTSFHRTVAHLLRRSVTVAPQVDCDKRSKWRSFTSRLCRARRGLEVASKFVVRIFQHGSATVPISCFLFSRPRRDYWSPYRAAAAGQYSDLSTEKNEKVLESFRALQRFSLILSCLQPTMQMPKMPKGCSVPKNSVLLRRLTRLGHPRRYLSAVHPGGQLANVFDNSAIGLVRQDYQPP